MTWFNTCILKNLVNKRFIFLYRFGPRILTKETCKIQLLIKKIRFHVRHPCMSTYTLEILIIEYTIIIQDVIQCSLMLPGCASLPNWSSDDSLQYHIIITYSSNTIIDGRNQNNIIEHLTTNDRSHYIRHHDSEIIRKSKSYPSQPRKLFFMIS